MIDGQMERQDKGEIKSETKRYAHTQRKEQQMTGQMQRHGDRWMVKQAKRIDQEGLGLVPARTKAPGLEVKCCGLST